MNPDDIIRWAREAGASEPESLFGRTDYIVMTRFELECFAYLVAAAWREKCAKKCESYIAAGIGKEMADAIRAMSNE